MLAGIGRQVLASGMDVASVGTCCVLYDTWRFLSSEMCPSGSHVCFHLLMQALVCITVMQAMRVL